MAPLDITLISLLTLAVGAWAYREGIFSMQMKLQRKKYADLEKSSARSKEHFVSDRQAVLEAMGDAFLVADRHGRVLIANRAASILLGESGRVGGNVFLSPEHETLHQFYREIFRNCDPVSQKITVSIGEGQGGSGSEKVLQVVSTPLQEDLNQIGILFHDITEEHRTMTVRRDFVANASHELRTPLTIIHGYLENLLEDDDIAADAAMRKRILGMMQRHCKRIIRIVEDMLMISKLENSENLLKRTLFDLGTCVEDVIGRLETMAHEKQATIRVELDRTPFMIYGDMFYWTQILFNLIENAIKQNLEPGLTVTVKAGVRDGKTVISVSDNGIGIPVSHLPYIFNRFYRVETAHSQQIKGTGLGLSIVRRAVEAHQGTIDVASIPGVETCFTIVLPQLPAPSPSAS